VEKHTLPHLRCPLCLGLMAISHPPSPSSRLRSILIPCSSSPGSIRPQNCSLNSSLVVCGEEVPESLLEPNRFGFATGYNGGLVGYWILPGDINMPWAL
jgi:hypothetical protein